MNNAAYGKTMEISRNRVDIRVVKKKRDYLKQTSKPSSLTQKTSENDLVVIHKLKKTFTIKKLPCAGRCILDLSKLPMYKFQMIIAKINMAINQNYYSQILATQHTKTHEITTHKQHIFVGIKRCLILVIILLSQNITIIQTHQLLVK